jgi:hypothetical protein
MNAVDRFLAGVTSAGVADLDVWETGAVLDATVPNWRMRAHGPREIRTMLSGWYAAPGRFEDLIRTPIPDGELIEFLLVWTEAGVPHAAHQAHVVRTVEDAIVSHVVYCGGRWPAGLLAQMAEASGD